MVKHVSQKEQKWIVIRELTDIKDFMKIPWLITKAWQLELEIDLFSTQDRQVSLNSVKNIIQQVVPPTEIKAVVHAGGLVLGAFTNDEKEMIGFIYAIPEHVKSDELFLVPIKRAHHSHMMGILPQYQHHGVGFQLKLAHRHWALKNDIQLITWTFDPLLSANAYLNFHKLGGITRKIYPNFYGEMEFSPLYKGVPSDRFVVEWYINTKYVKERITNPVKPETCLKRYLDEGYKEVRTRRNEQGFVVPPKLNELPQAPEKGVILQVPEDSVSLRIADPRLNVEWRHFLRKVFTQFLNIQGYAIIDYLTLLNEKRNNFYVMARDLKPDQFHVME